MRPAAASCELPDGRRLSLDSAAADRLCCGVVVLAGVTVDDGQGAAEETVVLGEGLRTAHAGRLPSEIPALAPARTLYKSFGMDPSRHRPSSEALLRRILKGQDLYRINSAVDSCNLASVTFVLPIGMYDLAEVRGDVVLREGRAGESYPGIRKGPVNLGGRLGLFDDEGPFGSPSSDSARTSVSERTTDILAVIMAPGGYSQEVMRTQVATFGGIFGRHCGSRILLGEVLAGGGGSR